MALYCMVCHCIAWNGVVWCCMAWWSWCCMVWQQIALHMYGVALYVMVWHSIAWFAVLCVHCTWTLLLRFTFWGASSKSDYLVFIRSCVKILISICLYVDEAQMLARVRRRIDLTMVLLKIISNINPSQTISNHTCLWGHICDSGPVL